MDPSVYTVLTLPILALIVIIGFAIFFSCRHWNLRRFLRRQEVEERERKRVEDAERDAAREAMRAFAHLDVGKATNGDESVNEQEVDERVVEREMDEADERAQSRITQMDWLLRIARRDLWAPRVDSK